MKAKLKTVRAPRVNLTRQINSAPGARGAGKVNLTRQINSARRAAAVRNALVANPSLQARVAHVNRWRETYNPLRNLTLSRAVSLVEAAQRGEYVDLMWTYASPWTGIEVADPDLLALIERTCAPFLEMDWEYQIAEEIAADPALRAQAVEQQEALTRVVEQIDNFYDFIEHLAMARFRGFSMAQPMDASRELVAWSTCRSFKLVDQWNLVRDGLSGAWYYNPEAKSMSAVALGQDALIDPATVVLRTRQRHVNRYGLFKFVRALLSEKDWDGFIEIFGIEQPIITLPLDTPDERIDEIYEEAEKVATGGGGVITGAADVKYPAAGVRGNQPFEARLRWLTERLVLAGTGGQLTMLTASGSGTLAGGAHSETFKQIARGEARRISEVIQRQFDRRVLAELFPGQPQLAYFNLQANEEVDVGRYIENVTRLASSGYITPQEEVAETTGMKVVYTGVPTAPAAAGPSLTVRNRAPSGAQRDQIDLHLAILRDTMQEAARADQADAAPIAARVQALLEIDDPAQFAEALYALYQDAPTFITTLREDGSELADVLERAMSSELVNGVAQAMQEAKS